MPRAGRLTVCVLAILLALPLFLKGRASRDTSGGAAFLRAGAGTVLVRLAGDFPRPGVYNFTKNVTLETVTKMTLSPPFPVLARAVKYEDVLRSGDILTLSRRDGEVGVLTVEKMAARERILFGIPLDLDAMRDEDWRALPGIGPVLAARIAADRQENGGFGSVEGLRRVRGIGPQTIARIRKYF